MPKVRKREILESVFLLEFPSQYELAATFLRFQEHYESPRFRGRIFTLEQYMDWYAGRNGNFTYYEDWSGFNVPSWVLTPFYAGRFDPLLDKESRLLDLFRNERGRFYIIGLARENARLHRPTLVHEIAHGLFSTRDSYRRDVLALLEEHDTRVLQRELAKAGYCKQVLLDEVHAGLLTPERGSASSARRLAPLRRKLRTLFRAHGGRDAVERITRG